MNCPYCNKPIEKGILTVDEAGIVNFIYRSEEDAEKKGLFERLKTNPVPFVVNRSNKMESYRCKECRKIVAVFDETFTG